MGALPQGSDSLGEADNIEADVSPPRRKAGGEVRWGGAVLVLSRLAMIAVFLLVWQFASGRLIPRAFISDPQAVLSQLSRWIADGSLWFNLGITLESTLIGYACGAAVGIVTGFTLGRAPFAASVLDPFINAAYALPKIALAPLFILWFGIDQLPKIVLASVLVFFLVFYNTLAGVRDCRRDLIEVVTVMGASRLQVLRLVVLPSSLVWIFTGLRIAAPYALTGAVVGELLASNKGLGFLIELSTSQFNPAGIFAVLFVLAVVAALFNVVVVRLEDSALRWKRLEK
jgi:NitT/TauT family transport system permease protein